MYKIFLYHVKESNNLKIHTVEKNIDDSDFAIKLAQHWTKQPESEDSMNPRFVAIVTEAIDDTDFGFDFPILVNSHVAVVISGEVVKWPSK